MKLVTGFQINFLCNDLDQVNHLKDLRGGIQKKLGISPALLILPLSAFHDCVGDRCDGCVNLDQEDNRGLEKIIETYEGMLEDPKVKPFFTRADLWALGGVQATMWGAIIANTFGW